VSKVQNYTRLQKSREQKNLELVIRKTSEILNGTLIKIYKSVLLQ